METELSCILDKSSGRRMNCMKKLVCSAKIRKAENHVLWQAMLRNSFGSWWWEVNLSVQNKKTVGFKSKSVSQYPAEDIS